MCRVYKPKVYGYRYKDIEEYQEYTRCINVLTPFRDKYELRLEPDDGHYRDNDEYHTHTIITNNYCLGICYISLRKRAYDHYGIPPLILQH